VSSCRSPVLASLGRQYLGGADRRGHRQQRLSHLAVPLGRGRGPRLACHDKLVVRDDQEPRRLARTLAEQLITVTTSTGLNARAQRQTRRHRRSSRLRIPMACHPCRPRR